MASHRAACSSPRHLDQVAASRFFVPACSTPHRRGNVRGTCRQRVPLLTIASANYPMPCRGRGHFLGRPSRLPVVRRSGTRGCAGRSPVRHHGPTPLSACACSPRVWSGDTARSRRCLPAMPTRTSHLHDAPWSQSSHSALRPRARGSARLAARCLPNHYATPPSRGADARGHRVARRGQTFPWRADCVQAPSRHCHDAAGEQRTPMDALPASPFSGRHARPPRATAAVVIEALTSAYPYCMPPSRRETRRDAASRMFLETNAVLRRRAAGVRSSA